MLQKPFIKRFKEKETFDSEKGRQLPDEFVSFLRLSSG